MGALMDNFDSLRSRMVVGQLVTRGIANKSVLEAFGKVERHLFVQKSLENQAYEDVPLPIEAGQTISQPYIVAYMTAQARIDKSSRVLEIGTGSGYQAAILAEICKEVYTIEILEELAFTSFPMLESTYGNINTKLSDGYDGWEEKAPFDAIIITASPNKIPTTLVDQLKIGGRIILPLEDEYGETILLRGIKNEQGKCNYEELMQVRFVPMIGKVREES